ncbi:holo-(acyl-carrier-protein) synthase [Thecamonas trahens ATCC 50062]|uniref:Holo-(Acyl-carrier-protein) synthase n=1 Tax=Thecamonas trahens ATCC 50062 TaxID=461836 RepID=A0A0L0DAT2_THETB|nr:holo-(acyl-carrier-protein) synthase [Thecamonas trahens ATCC 50062]KNC49191.1 holo-(acyl-carrier-protein) synthase [Thecamonas trahens ATCC 50062]|eukprot:XP_013758210.1 holo-(acyl-carrier-protein) synthase [Thecamonas trahens ATCC 50062]
MRVLGLGTDIVSVARVAATVGRTGGRFVQRVLTSNELQEYSARLSEVGEHGAHQYLAAQWAAKEAVYKALGGESVVVWRDVEVLRAPSGAPTVTIPDDVVTDRGIDSVLISLSHEESHAVATAIVQGRRTA